MKNELLHNFVEELKKNGFQVYTSDSNDDYSYCHFVKDNKIGYAQSNYFSGLDFSTVHKPCTNFGTGFGIKRENCHPTIADAEETFYLAPNWAGGNLGQIKKYKNWADYLQQPTNKILEQREL